ncbi:FtsX-like permease family protein [Noviherbaspirillum sp.]|uniref:FtsX-like permease family protein n=1 Tax=Noviherbaspirillum sp. TaxID=1926288 RepID=UPI002B487E1E|nr:FtsX-like permease family protein [Noviherbaspirillum sp.]HJV80137.1 FtsX-like permease family protein [Noviherbaspirillum sp.]
MSGGQRSFLGQWLTLGEWRAHPVRTLIATGAIALGVALGFAIHLINAAAYNEFSAAIKSLSGQADLQVRSTQAFFDESLYPRLAQHEGIALANPVLEIDAAIPGQRSALKILGIDMFKAAAIAPDLIGMPAEDRPFDTLADDAIFLSPAAMEWLQVRRGDRLELRVGTRALVLRVAGGLVRARAGQRIAVMDIGAAQWRFGRIGQLSHIDLKLAAGIDRAAFKAALARELQPQYLVTETEDQEERTNNMSRAYRVNLNVLALVALFTGAFLVFSTQALSVIRRRSQLALLRVIGMTRRQVLGQILLEGGLLGVTGSLLGLAGGYAIAAAALRLFGGDLGGGYFPGVQPTVQFSPWAAALFFALGTLAALLGCASPAWEAARARPAQAIKSGSEDVALSRLSSPWPSLTCLAAGALLTRLPPVFELPLFGYLAIALLLIGGLGLMPRFSALAFAMLSGITGRKPQVIATLTLARLANAPNQAAIALGGVLSSFSLLVAMAIMVASFRVSVDNWLSDVLSADLYVRSALSGNTGALSPADQQAIASLPGVARADFLRTLPLVLDPARPPVTLMARPIDVVDPGKTLPLAGKALSASELPAGVMPIWVSEAVIDLYRFRVGARVSLNIAGRTPPFVVAGVWRDYARQSGAIQMRLSDYRSLSGDMEVNDAALRLRSGIKAEQVIAELRRLPFGAALEFALPGDIRAITLKIFDRSFAVTYLLEVVAIVIGLFGVAATFSAQTLARAKEFGMLRHIGVTRRQILAMLAIEGGLLSLLGVATGFLLGGAISLILVFVVNPQSFHWTMQLHMPWNVLLTVAAVLSGSAAVTALIAGRYAVSGQAVRAVREDW